MARRPIGMLPLATGSQSDDLLKEALWHQSRAPRFGAWFAVQPKIFIDAPPQAGRSTKGLLNARRSAFLHRIHRVLQMR
jgi:hypothetical protein